MRERKEQGLRCTVQTTLVNSVIKLGELLQGYGDDDAGAAVPTVAQCRDGCSV